MGDFKGIMADISRESMLLACAAGDRAALNRLYTVAAPHLLGLALGILRRRDLAEDAVQETFLQVWRHARSFDPGRGTAMAWMARILRNRCLDMLDKRRRETTLEPEIMEARADPGPGPADLVAGGEEARRLHDCLNEIEARARQCLNLAYYEGLTMEEIARRLPAPIGTVKSWVRRSLIRLKGCLER
jgi:RNA polymerase sigma-70 factor (ECF subfamily)